LARRASPRPVWTSPPTEQLLVLERQMQDALAEGERTMTRPYEDGWGAWSTNLGDLISRAFGDESPQSNAFQYSGGFFADGPDARDMSVSDYKQAMVEWRNEKISGYITHARGALKAIAQELERRGATPGQASWPRRDFALIRSDPLRAIATRDYDELRGVAGMTVKATALLAGSVVEAVLHDALERNGFSPSQLDSMRFHELVDEAANAKLISDRTKKAAHVARDIRNLVHPVVELRDGRLRKVDADQAIAVMQMVLEELA
jgi:hypothetical protein